MFGHSTETEQLQLDPTRYLKDMTRKERYEWDNYDISPLERLETIIEVVKKGLQVDERDKPGVEKDLIALELVSDEAQGIINRSWLVAAAVGILVPAVVGIATAINNSVATGIGAGMICILPSIIFGIPVSHMILSDFIFTPQANKYVDQRIKF